MRLGAHFGVVGIGAVIAAPAHAQDLTLGKWSGNLNISGAQVAVEYTVTVAGDAPQAIMNAVDGPPSPVKNLRVTDGEMTFDWGSFSCSLIKIRDATYLGECTTSDGSQGVLTLAPPHAAAQEAASDAARDVLTTEELVATEASNVWDALQRLRPRWLRARSAGRTISVVMVAVYLDGVPKGYIQQGVDPRYERNPTQAVMGFGGESFLRTLECQSVTDVRFYSAVEATTIFGSHNTGGVIAISRR